MNGEIATVSSVRIEELVDPLAPTLAALETEPAEARTFTDSSRPLPGTLPTSYAHLIWRLAWTDGRIAGTSEPAGLKPYFVQEAQAVAAKAADDRIRRREEQRLVLANLQNEKDRCSGELAKLDAVEDRLSSHSLVPNRWSPLLVGIVLLVAALLLMIADLPLTAQLAGKSLGFRDALCVDENGSITNTAVGDCDPQNIRRAEKLVFVPLQMLRYFPEILSLALGLVAAGFLFKVCLDVIAHYYADWRNQRFKLVATAMVALLMTATLAVLGIVRSQAFEAETSELRAKRDDAGKQLESLNRQISTAASSEREALSNERTRIENLRKGFDIQVGARGSVWVTVGFVLITLLFPIAGGVLLFFAIRAFHLWSAHIILGPRRERFSTEQRRLSGEIAEREAECAKAEREIARLQDRDAVLELGGQWYLLYCQGWGRGVRARQTLDTNPSPYQRALYAIDRQLAGALPR